MIEQFDFLKAQVKKFESNKDHTETLIFAIVSIGTKFNYENIDDQYKKDAQRYAEVNWPVKDIDGSKYTLYFDQTADNEFINIAEHACDIAADADSTHMIILNDGCENS